MVKWKKLSDCEENKGNPYSSVGEGCRGGAIRIGSKRDHGTVEEGVVSAGSGERRRYGIENSGC